MENLDLFENFDPKGRKHFTESEISYYQKLWDSLNQKYRYNKFFSTIWEQAKRRKSLSHKQWRELEFLLKNGSSRYESGILPSNY